jgi:hypothetical protein
MRIKGVLIIKEYSIKMYVLFLLTWIVSMLFPEELGVKDRFTMTILIGVCVLLVFIVDELSFRIDSKNSKKDRLKIKWFVTKNIKELTQLKVRNKSKLVLWSYWNQKGGDAFIMDKR